MNATAGEPVALVELGRVEKPHGLKGELCITLFADSPLIFADLTRIYLRQEGKKPRACAVLAAREHQGRALVFVDRCQGRDQAEFWRGALVLARERDLPPVESDPFCLDDLLGLAVRHVTGADLGTLEDIQDIAGQVIWCIHDEKGCEILLPAVDEFIVDIDVDAGVIVVDPPEGLVELYQHAT
ncbi:ribosome maturation factor RimM [Desulfovibrionales bacterium]